LMRI